MAICSFFLKGNCRFGNTCRNEHPQLVNPSRQGGFGNQGWTNTRNSSSNTGAKPSLPFSTDSLKNDLTPQVDKPIWPLSSFAPSKHEPVLLGGLDESPEELRVKAVQAIAAGNINEYLAYEANKISAAEQVYANARSNLTQAYDQAVKQSNLPALLASQNGASTLTVTTSAFGSGTPSAVGSTSTPQSAFGSTTTPSAFGSATTTSAFGNTTTPSAFGNTSTPSAFGSTSTPSAFGSTTTPSAFGSTTTPSAFGNTTTPSAFASTPSAFASSSSAFSSTTTQPSAFGSTITPSAFSNNTTTPSAFGSSNTTTPSAFGKSAFGQPAFGQTPTPAASTNTTSAFGQPPAFGSPSAFGQPAASSVIKPATGAFSAFAGTTPTAFGAGASNTSNTTNSAGTGGGFSAFANAGQQPSPFGAGAANGGGGSGAFGQSGFGTTPAQGTPAFGAPAPVTSAFGGTNTSTTSAFGQSAFGQTSQPSAFSAFGQNAGGGMNKAISAFGQPQQTVSAFASSQSQSQSNPFQQTQPDLPVSSTPSITKPAPAAKGPPDFLNAPSTFRPGLTPYDSQLPSNYTTILPGLAMEAFKATKFEWGKVPEWIPPVELRGPQGATFS